MKVFSSSIELARRDEFSNEGATRTIDAAHFDKWVEHCLCPILGRCDKGEPRSIVVIDNASTHVGSVVAPLIRDKGACILCTTPCSLDLNLIELMFNVCKAHLKMNSTTFEHDRHVAHLKVAEEVNRDTRVMECR